MDIGPESSKIGSTIAPAIYGNALNSPVYRPKAPESSVEGGPLDEHLFSEVADAKNKIDTAFSRPAPVGGVTISEAVPVMLGMQKWFTEKRIDKAESKIRTLAERQEVVRHVGESIIKGKGYLKPENPLRPVSHKDRSLAKRLEKLAHSRRQEQAHGTNIHKAYPVEVERYARHDPLTGHHQHSSFKRRHHVATEAPTIAEIKISQGQSVEAGDHVKARLTFKQRMNRARNVRHYRHLEHQINQSDMEFAHIVSSPTVEAKKLAEKREDLIQKSHEISAAQVAKTERKDEKEAQKKYRDPANGASWTDGTYGYQVTSKNPDGSARITIFDGSGPVGYRDVSGGKRNLKKVANSYGAKF
jgi:hypothetical protein